MQMIASDKSISTKVKPFLFLIVFFIAFHPTHLLTSRFSAAAAAAECSVGAADLTDYITAG
jgi:hypothetical protein